MSSGAGAPAVLEVLRAGALTTVQDLGRPGHAASGVPRAGAMDPWAARAANRALGNPDGAAVLEITLAGPTLRCHVDLQVAIAGDPFEWSVEPESELRLGTRAGVAVTELRQGSELRFGRARSGVRAWIAFTPGIDVPDVLGSCSTDLAGGFGGLAGRPLAAGDRLRLRNRGRAGEGAEAATTAVAQPARGRRFQRGKDESDGRRRGTVDGASAAQFPFYGSFSGGWGSGGSAHESGEAETLRVLEGPDLALLGGWEALDSIVGRVDPRSDRRGVRLRIPAEGGSAALSLAPHPPLRSQPVLFGAVQAPSASELILLGPDAPVTGGYPWVAQVIEADLGRLGHLAPGARVRLVRVDVATAERALAERWSALDEGGSAKEGGVGSERLR